MGQEGLWLPVFGIVHSVWQYVNPNHNPSKPVRLQSPAGVRASVRAIQIIDGEFDAGAGPPFAEDSAHAFTRSLKPGADNPSAPSLPHYVFFGAAFLAGATAHRVVFKFSSFAFSVSMVSMNGSLVNAFGTPVH